MEIYGKPRIVKSMFGNCLGKAVDNPGTRRRHNRHTRQSDSSGCRLIFSTSLIFFSDAWRGGLTVPKVSYSNSAVHRGGCNSTASVLMRRFEVRPQIVIEGIALDLGWLRRRGNNSRRLCQSDTVGRRAAANTLVVQWNLEGADASPAQSPDADWQIQRLENHQAIPEHCKIQRGIIRSSARLAGQSNPTTPQCRRYPVADESKCNKIATKVISCARHVKVQPRLAPVNLCACTGSGRAESDS